MQIHFASFLNVLNRQGKELPQSILFEKANFVKFLVDHFVVEDSVQNRSGCFFIRGLLMNCANAIRLQMSTQTSSTYLNSLLGNHSGWKDFLPHLVVSFFSYRC